MGRPINKRYFGSTKAATAQSAQNPTVDGKDQAGNTLTSTSSYSEKKLGYNMPVYSARVSNNGTTQTEVQIDPAVSEYPYIVKQTGSRSYLVRTSATASHVGRCKLVNKAAGTLAAGEMILQGYPSGDAGAGDPVNIARLTKFYAIDFSGNRYKWYVDFRSTAGNDSTMANVLILAAVTDLTIN
jgi:hypothetical protein